MPGEECIGLGLSRGGKVYLHVISRFAVSVEYKMSNYAWSVLPTLYPCTTHLKISVHHHLHKLHISCTRFAAKNDICRPLVFAIFRLVFQRIQESGFLREQSSASHPCCGIQASL